MKVRELIERLNKIPQDEEVVFSLEAVNGHAEYPIYYVGDVWEAVLFNHKKLDRPHIRHIQRSEDICIGEEGTKLVCALFPH